MVPFSIVPDHEPPPDAPAAVDPAAARLPRANPREVAHVLAAAPEQWAPFAPITDTDAWKAVAARFDPATVTAWVESGHTAAERTTPALPATLWRAYTRTGDRQSYETPWYERRALLADMLVAYCLAPDDHLLDRLVDLLWAVCEETSWCFPAHDPVELPDPDRPVVDLFASLTAVGLAECLQILRPVLPERLTRRVEREVMQRVVTPYLVDDSWGWLYNRPGRSVNNWAAVCAYGAVGAACYLERDPTRLATILSKAARSLEDYLETFDPDGGTSEGSGYWNFGFGSFCELAELVERRTGGAWNWLDAPIVEKVAVFPLRSRLTVDSWPTFSDSDPGPRFPGRLLTQLGERFGRPDLTALAGSPLSAWGARTGALTTRSWPGRSNSAVSTALRSLHAGTGTDTGPVPVPEPSSWFRGLQWLLSRADPADPDTLAVAVKGGHNAEMHNQNDVGSLVVRAGGEDLIVDPGRGLYTRDYFNEHRYEHFVNRSFGHSVPRPAGVEQAEGMGHRASVLEVEQGDAADRVGYDLTAAYPDAAGLRRLTRTVALHRDGDPWVELVDEVDFTTPAVAESAFVTFAAVTVEAGQVALRGERAALVVSLPDGVEVDVTTEDVPLAFGVRSISRVAVRSSTAVEHARFAFRISPV